MSSSRQVPPPLLRQQPTSRPSHSQYSPPPLSPPPFQPSFPQLPSHQQHQSHQPHQQQAHLPYPPIVNQQSPSRQGYTLTDQSHRHQAPFRQWQQQQPYRYQPQSPHHPSSQHQPPFHLQSQYQTRSQYQPQAHRTPRQEPSHQQHSPLPQTGNNVNNNVESSLVPLILIRQQSANPLAPSTAPFPSSFNHALTPSTPVTTETIELHPLHSRFGSNSTYNSNERPYSVASISNLSTHSDEPLNPPLKKAAPNRTYSKKNTRMNYNGNNARPAASQRSFAPQPWRSDNNRVDKNPLDLPEQNKRMEHIDDDNDGDDFEEREDNNNNNNRRRSYPNSGKARSKPRFFSRMRDRLRTKVPSEYKVTGTGRLAQFSNERLYLHWIRFGILQGGVAVLLLSYGIGIAEYIGVGAFVMALLTLIYSTTMYHLRHLYMITKRKDAIYFQRWIPTLLALGLMALYMANFILTVTFGEGARSPPPWTAYDKPFGK